MWVEIIIIFMIIIQRVEAFNQPKTNLLWTEWILLVDCLWTTNFSQFSILPPYSLPADFGPSQPP